MTFGSLFAGIGGFDLGLERAGLSCTWQVEIDERCRSLLAGKWPKVERHRDVRTVGTTNLAPVDLICGGFPCQDVSVAGRRAGLAGIRSGLWWQFHRILGVARPRWCLIENVPGLLSSGPTDEARAPLSPGLDFAVVVAGLVELGYRVCWRILDAQFAGLAQRRERVFIVGSLGDGRSAQVLLEPESVRWVDPPRRRSRQDTAPPRAGDRGGDGLDGRSIANTVTARQGPHGAAGAQVGDTLIPDVAWALQERDAKGPDSDTKVGHLLPAMFADPRRHDDTHRGRGLRELPTLNTTNNDLVCAEVADPLVVNEGATYTHEGANNFRIRNLVLAGRLGLRRLTPRECERLQGFPDDWTAGYSDSCRYKMLGNAVPPPEAFAIGSRILSVCGR